MNAMQMPVCIKLEDNFWDQLMWDKDLTDTKIQVKGKDGQVRWEFSLHSIVLRRRSKVFKQLITEIGQTIVIEDVNISVLNKFVKYMYMGDVFVETWREVLSLVELSTKYEVTSLTKELEATLPKFVNFVNVCELLDEAMRLELTKLECECLSFIARSGMVIFGTASFLGLSESALVKILCDDRLNVVREVDILLALICWARNSSFLVGSKLDDQGLYEKIAPRLLKCIRKTLIKDEERNLIPESLRKLIFAKNEEPEEVEGDEDGEEAEKEEEEKPRTPLTEECLLGHFATVLFRRAELSISWPNMGNAVTLAVRFSVTMPIFLGGFLAISQCNGGTNLHIIVQDTKKDTPEVKHVFKSKKCEHKIYNEEQGTSWYQSVCFEPDTPILVLPGQQVSVFFQLVGTNYNYTPMITFPTTVFPTGEGPTIQLSIDKVYGIRRMYFMSACGMCSASPLSV